MRALEHGDSHGCEAIQIFTANANRWESAPRDPQEINAFVSRAQRRRKPLLAHDSYLINLAAPGGDLLARSRKAFLLEIDRCEQLGIDYLVMHPGAHVGQGVPAGLTRVVESLQWALRSTRGYRVRVLMELTAGQGTSLGMSFGELRMVLDGVAHPERMGICFDTCHALVAGYDLVTPEGYEAVWEEFDESIGLEHLFAFHLNDSKKQLGSRVDRHAPVGAGFVGAETFQRLVNDPRFANVPGVVELPPKEAQRSVEVLKSWRSHGKD